VLTKELHARWRRGGFFILHGFAPQSTCQAMLDRAIQISREADAGAAPGSAYIQPEGKLRATARAPEERTSKIFRVHREDPVFHSFCKEEPLLDTMEELIAPDLDCFLSQFIFKQPGALGQPWHQDAFYFPFDREPQVGVWLAVTEAAADNGPLHVLPGSHLEAVHPVVADRRKHANFGYVEIIDHDMSKAIPVLMQPGDLLIFHSHLMHRSTDNESSRLRAAMVYHYSEGGTVDRTEEHFGFKSPNNDWMPVRRSNRP